MREGTSTFYLPIRPIFMPERARARKADCAPGPGVFVLQSKNHRLGEETFQKQFLSPDCKT